MKAKAYVIVEGRGEVEAVQNLLFRLSTDLGRSIPWTSPRKFSNLTTWDSPRFGIANALKFIRTKNDVGALLILSDADDICPKAFTPLIGNNIRQLNLSFPVAYVMLRPEYEVLFLPCLAQMSEIGLPANLSWDSDNWESRRGVKEWISKQLPVGRTYKPTVDQLRLTRLIDFELLRDANVPSFGSLERGVCFLDDNFGIHGVAYP